MSGLLVRCLCGRAHAKIYVAVLLTLLDIGCKRSLCVASARGSGVVKGKDGEADASERISLRRIRYASRDCCKHAGIATFSNEARLTTAAITSSAGVTFGFEMYLCLWNTVADTLLERVFNIQKVHAQ